MPFVEVNCAAIPSELIESELFGHEKGSFTSAIKLHKGKFEQADGGIAEIEKGNVREDLYYRLSAIVVKVPSLDERKDDIPLLVRHFQDQYCQNGMARKEFSEEAVQLLMQKNWPGNIRELGNVVERLMILGDQTISAANVRDFVNL